MGIIRAPEEPEAIDLYQAEPRRVEQYGTSIRQYGSVVSRFRMSSGDATATEPGSTCGRRRLRTAIATAFLLIDQYKQLAPADANVQKISAAPRREAEAGNSPDLAEEPSDGAAGRANGTHFQSLLVP